MPAVKRKAPPTLGAKLQRRVRPRFEAEPDSDVEGSSDEAPSEEEGGRFQTGSDTEEEEEDEDIEEGSEPGSDDVRETFEFFGFFKNRRKTILSCQNDD